ncbi:MAG: phosphotransferase [Chthoniobacterales bacterium]|nr:phosphotransferase [Chthoniobacterales bacterium]
MKKPNEPLRSASQRALAAVVTPEFAQAAAALWEAKSTLPEPLHAVQNFVFAIERPAGPAILRLTHESHRSPDQVEAELRWILDLAERGLAVAKPYRSNNDAWLETVASSNGQFIATCFERLANIEPSSDDPASWDEQLLKNLGSTIAKLHRASREAAWDPAALLRPSWRQESVVRNFHSLVPASEAAIHRAYDRVLAELDSLPRSPDSYGLIHADLNDSNFFLTGEGANVFDFDDSCYGWFAFDLIVPIFHFPTADQATMDAAAQRALRWLVRGYERVSRFNRTWFEWLPLFLKWRDLITYGFFYEQLEIAALPDTLRQTFLGMRARIEADQPIANLGPAG